MAAAEAAEAEAAKYRATAEQKRARYREPWTARRSFGSMSSTVALLIGAAASSAADRFELVGNGFCVDAAGRRLKLGPRPETHGRDLQWQRTEVGHDGGRYKM